MAFKNSLQQLWGVILHLLNVDWSGLFQLWVAKLSEALHAKDVWTSRKMSLTMPLRYNPSSLESHLIHLDTLEIGSWWSILCLRRSSCLFKGTLTSMAEVQPGWRRHASSRKCSTCEVDEFSKVFTVLKPCQNPKPFYQTKLERFWVLTPL